VKKYDKYGFKGSTLREIAALLEETLGIYLSERESSYYAGTYFLYKLSTGRELRVYRNYDEVQKQWVRSQFRDYDIVVEVNDLDDTDEIRRRLERAVPQAVLLASKIFPTP
jgi:hypothetical protein